MGKAGYKKVMSTADGWHLCRANKTGSGLNLHIPQELAEEGNIKAGQMYGMKIEGGKLAVKTVNVTVG